MSKVRRDFTIRIPYPGIHFYWGIWFGFKLVKRMVVLRMAILSEPAKKEETKSWKTVISQS